MIASTAHQRPHAFVIKASAPRTPKVDAQLASRGPPTGMNFPLSHLPLELALEIIRLAALPSIHSRSGSPAAIYAPACALAQVSHSVRQVAMPHLLHTVIFSTQDALDLFVRALALQRHLAATRSRLRLDYAAHVRRIWATRCYPPLVQQPAGAYHNYGVLYPLLARARCVGLHADALHLLHDAVGGGRASTLPAWACRRAVLAGHELRWNSLVGTAPGAHFLAQLTHLALWSNGTPGSAGGRVPGWVQRVPFECMPALTHLAFNLASLSPTQASILVCALPAALHGLQAGGSTFRKWIESDNPLEYGTIIESHVDPWVSKDFGWESAFAGGEDDVWDQARQ